MLILNVKIMKTIKNVIIKSMEKFVSNLQNDTFASKFKENLIKFNDRLEMAVKFIILTRRRFYKYSDGTLRVKRFLIKNIRDFEKDHRMIVSLIDDRSLDDEGNMERYLKCKNRVSATLKANRRIMSFKVMNNDEMKSYLNEYIFRKRFFNNYELAT